MGSCRVRLMSFRRGICLRCRVIRFNPGHPIQYKVDETGYIIYVAGSDGDLDDGNEPDPDDRERKSFRLRFTGNLSACKRYLYGRYITWDCIA